MTGNDSEKLRSQAEKCVTALARDTGPELLEEAKSLIGDLCSARLYEPLCDLAEAFGRRSPHAKVRRLYAQALIERGLVTAAIDVLTTLQANLLPGDAEAGEVTGLLGRCQKQVYFDFDDPLSPDALKALEEAIRIYRQPFEENPGNSWHGINYIALMLRARDAGLAIAASFDIEDAARRLLATLEAQPVCERDKWHAGTLAEVHLALGNWGDVENHVRSYAGAGAKAFQIASILRQFSKLWNIEKIDPERGSRIVSVLRARLLQLEGGALELSVDELDEERERLDETDKACFEAILGTAGTETYDWWQTGLDSASAVASIRQKGGSRIGTGFLIKASALGLAGHADELVVLTNNHVVCESGGLGMPPSYVEVTFESAKDRLPIDIEAIIWESPSHLHDATVLKLARPIEGVKPLVPASELPSLAADSRVYIIGHPGGREMAFSFQDNELLDHEGPPNGQPSIKGVERVHYRAPTEPGSSGSPVFNNRRWQVIALHHKGWPTLPKLNGKLGTYGANQGISIQSIQAAIKASLDPTESAAP